MKQFKVVRVSNMWSTAELCNKVEMMLVQLDIDGYEIVNVSFGFNVLLIPTAFITVKK